MARVVIEVDLDYIPTHLGERVMVYSWPEANGDQGLIGTGRVLTISAPGHGYAPDGYVPIVCVLCGEGSKSAAQVVCGKCGACLNCGYDGVDGVRAMDAQDEEESDGTA